MTRFAPFLCLFGVLFAVLAGPDPLRAQTRRPVIERLRPTAGPPGTEVDVIGRHFTGGMMFLGERQLPPVRQSPNRWTVRIPEDARTGRVQVRTAGGSFRGPEFRVIPPPPSPTVSGVTPDRARPGTTVVIEGTEFSARPGETEVRFGEAEAVVRNATPTRLEVVVPEGGRSGPIEVRVRYAAEVAKSPLFTVQQPTAITAIEPPVGPPGSEITLRGTGFSNRARDLRVLVGGRRARVLQATETTVVVRTPGNVRTGPVVVDVRGAGRGVSSSPFIVQPTPVLSGFSPAETLAGRRVTLRGRHFGDDPEVVTVTLDGREVPVASVRDRELVVTIPDGARSGDFAVTVRGVGPATTEAPFLVLAPMRIGDVTPRSGPPGTEVTLSGTGFSTDPENIRVTLAGTVLEVISSTTTEAKVRIPDEAESGPFIVSVDNGGSARTPTPFLVTRPPLVAGFAPAQAMVGDSVVITGSHFGDSRNAVVVRLGGRPMRVRSVADDRIEVEVPRGAESGRITVAVRLQGEDAAPTDFTVLLPFVLRGAEPARAWPGQRIRLTGQGFVPGTTVAFPGVRRPVTPDALARETLRVTVPTRARTGDLTVEVPDGRERTAAVEIVDVPDGLGIVELDAACRNPGCAVDLLGHGFGRRGRGTRVFWGETELPVSEASATALSVALPDTAGTAPFRVVRGDDEATSRPFSIVP